MTDERYNDLLRDVGKANTVYKNLLKAAEKEFYGRYGFHPSDNGFGVWIDTLHNGGCMTVAQIEQGLKDEGYLT